MQPGTVHCTDHVSYSLVQIMLATDHVSYSLVLYIQTMTDTAGYCVHCTDHVSYSLVQTMLAIAWYCTYVQTMSDAAW